MFKYVVLLSISFIQVEFSYNFIGNFFRMTWFSEALLFLMITTHMAGTYNELYEEKTDDILFRCCRIFWDLSLIISWLQICWSISLPRHKGSWGRSLYKEKTLTNGLICIPSWMVEYVHVCTYVCVNIINMWNIPHGKIIIFIPFIALTYTMLNTYPWFLNSWAFSIKVWGPMMFWSMISLQRTSRQYEPFFISVIRYYHESLDIV